MMDAPSLGIVGMESCWEVYKIFPGVEKILQEQSTFSKLVKDK